ncbi:AcrR family transcriptional regulator [Thermocatellispora tengchongensis]|uniref:AcrR family transcriptional regulator n=1 Tax=Thermocatellispora tengchongensis TaxID=1073253 RepID=A0A840PIC3_9ACTN|nr:helix-turn-helix domain-containing protein [Thermocatellispora tengchongensis]MBB5138729.1 AcrR family transcriptional regulator [Thermocatellispora tengchongensis]
MPDTTAPMRADARRNYDLLLEAARAAFAEHGVDASLRDVARRAGVGIGTLYRHFPTREALVEALLSHRFEHLRDRAHALLTAPDPTDALLEWLTALTLGSATYRGLPESVMSALSDDTSDLHASCVAMRAAGEALLTRAQQAGSVRPDVTINEVLALCAGIAWSAEHSAGTALPTRLLTLAMTGMTTPGTAEGA